MCSTLINKHVMSFVISTIHDKSTLTQRLVSFCPTSISLSNPPGQPYTQRSHKHLQLSPPTPLSPSSPPLPPSHCPDPSPVPSPPRRRRRRADACPFPPCNPRSPVGWLRVSFSRRRGSLRGNRCAISDLSGGGEKKGGEGC